MSDSNDVSAFVEASRASGLSDEEIISNMKASGWQESHAQQAVKGGILVPPPPPQAYSIQKIQMQTSAESKISLYSRIANFSLLAVVVSGCAFLSRAFSEMSGATASSSTGTYTSTISALLIGVPFFYFSNRSRSRELAKNPVVYNDYGFRKATRRYLIGSIFLASTTAFSLLVRVINHATTNNTSPHFGSTVMTHIIFIGGYGGMTLFLWMMFFNKNAES